MRKKSFLVPLVVSISLAIGISSFASETHSYSPYWNIDSANNWHYTLANGQVVTDAWIQDEVSGDWYLIDSVGNMKSGLVTSNGKYYLLDNTRGTGHFGKLLKNGEIYNGITIYADTSASYQGALNDITLNQLANMGLSVYSAENVTGTKQVSNGAIVNGGSASSASVGNSGLTGMNNAGAGLGATNTSTGTVSTAELEKYHTRKRLTPSEIDLLVNQYGLQIADMISGARPPFSQNRVALINYIDDNKCLVMVGDAVDVTGCYDYAAGGHVDYVGVASLSKIGLNS